MDDNDYISTAEAAEIMGFRSRRQVQNLARDGRLPSLRVGRDYLIRRGDAKALPAGCS